jgi:hypothetical protein
MIEYDLPSDLCYAFVKRGGRSTPLRHLKVAPPVQDYYFAADSRFNVRIAHRTNVSSKQQQSTATFDAVIILC